MTDTPINATSNQPKKRKHRVFPWFFLAVQALFLVWIIAGVNSSGPACDPSLSAEACQAASDIGTGIGVAVIIGLWVAADFILGITWLIVRKR